jgi:2-dehydro-3-deoxyphosphooctonate aldolase (KDO 8-P synthase)
MITPVKITDTISIGPGQPLLLLAGPCVIESEEICLQVASRLQELCAELGVNYVFKASFDKANRTSVSSFRGPGLERGLEILQKVKTRLNLPIVTDIHESSQAAAVAEVADILQIPAFLARQTDLLLAAGQTGRAINIKKGQFMAAEDMAHSLGKVQSTGNRQIILTERGTTFGYHNLVVDMRSLITMGELGAPVIFDATHSVQLPSGQGGASGGQREFILPLARAAAATGIHGLFTETHPEPEKALCDGANSIPLDQMKQLLTTIRDIHELVS